MDFTYGESDEDEFDVDDDYDDYEIDDEDRNRHEEVGGEEDNMIMEEDDRVFVLSGSVARFIPQWDEQILGPANTYSIKKNYDSPPKPHALSTIRSHYCPTCKLTWLVGGLGEAAAKNHPSHHTYSHLYAGTSRSMLVFTDGACSPNSGTAAARAGLGVFFGPESKFNISERYTESSLHTSQKAELAAVARALEIIRLDVLPERRNMVTSANGGHNPRAVKDVTHPRLVVVTDSSAYTHLILSPCTC